MAGLDQLYVAAHDSHRWVPVERRNILAGVAGQVRGLQ